MIGKIRYDFLSAPRHFVKDRGSHVVLDLTGCPVVAQPSLHIVARGRTTLVALLHEQLGRCARVCQHVVLPAVRSLGQADVLVVDLDDPQHQPVPTQLLPFLEQHDVWLAYGNGSVSAQWLEAARWPKVHFVHCDGMNRSAGLQSLVTSLVKQFVGPPSDELAHHIVNRERRLQSVAELVRAICDNPWRVRHPSQLAAAAGRRLAALKTAVRELGFARVEHFITYVRWSGFEQLVSVYGMRGAVAQQLTGIADPSNQRRQLDRLRRGSPSAVRTVPGLIAMLTLVIVPQTIVVRGHTPMSLHTHPCPSIVGTACASPEDCAWIFHGSGSPAIVGNFGPA